MPEKPTWEQIEQDRDKPVKLPLDPDAALKGLLEVDPESEAVESEEKARRAEPQSP